MAMALLQQPGHVYSQAAAIVLTPELLLCFASWAKQMQHHQSPCISCNFIASLSLSRTVCTTTPSKLLALSMQGLQWP